MPEGYEHPEEFPSSLGREDVDSGKPSKSTVGCYGYSEGRGERFPGWGGCHPDLAHDTLAGGTDFQDQSQVGPVMLALIPKPRPPFSAPVLSQGVVGRLREAWEGWSAISCNGGSCSFRELCF